MLALDLSRAVWSSNGFSRAPGCRSAWSTGSFIIVAWILNGPTIEPLFRRKLAGFRHVSKLVWRMVAPSCTVRCDLKLLARRVLELVEQKGMRGLVRDDDDAARLEEFGPAPPPIGDDAARLFN